MAAEFEYTRNEAVALMHRDRAEALKKLADHFEKWQPPVGEIVRFLREIADEAEAQAMVVELRDQL